MNGIPETFCFDTLPEDLEHIEPLLEGAIHRVPVLGHGRHPAVLQRARELHARRPLSARRDARVRGLFVAAGFNSIGIQSAGGAGKVLADWIVDGHPPMDLWDVDIRRCHALPAQPPLPAGPHGRSARPALRHALAVPPARDGARRAPLAAARSPGRPRRLLRRGRRLGARRTGSRPHGVGAGLRVQLRPAELVRLFGAGASAPCARASACSTRHRSPSSASRAPTPKPSSTASRANEVAVPVGRIVYTQWLNARGGIEADLTVTREAEDRFLIVTAAATQTRDFAWLRRHIPEGARAIAVDVTSAYAVLGVMGPRSRELLRADGRRPVQRGVPVRHLARDRPRLCPRPRQPHHLCRRARLGALHPDRVRPGVFDAHRRWKGRTSTCGSPATTP